VLEAEKAALQAQVESAAASSPATAPAPAPTSSGKVLPAPSASPNSSSEEGQLIARLRLELAEALRSKGQFQHRLEIAEQELSRLRAKTTADSKTIRELTAERKTLTIKLRDREEELRVKTKMIADVQDELAVLNMQLDMVEKQRAEKEAENKQLIDRFMKRVGEEAEALNLANEPLFNRTR
jgi:Chromosome segregation ATPases